ncbi:hypothetical protein R6Q57_012739 [Mikania cordata]
MKARLSTPSISLKTNDIEEDLGNYVLQIDNDMELAEKTLTGISKSMNSFILKAEKKEHYNLLELLNKSTGFKGVEIFDSDHVQSLLYVELVNSWSLPIVTITCIVVALPNIPKDTVGKLFKSVGEGISYTYLVDESLNRGSEYVCVRKASMSLWNEVENKWKWLGNPLAKDVFKGKTSTEILKWFSDKAKQIVTRINQSTDGELMENPHEKLIAANSISQEYCNTLYEFLTYGSYFGKDLSEVDIIQLLQRSCDALDEQENGDKYSKPMVWIGIYIAIASLLCTLAMAADLLHGFRSKKLWFPSKYFSLNAASITVIAVAMKLPVDLTSPMPSHIDQETKLGSLAFMCTMMANFLPSLASMDNKTLLANVTGFAILTITVIVNVCIQINTSVIVSTRIEGGNYHVTLDMFAYIYMALILVLLIIMISSSLTIPTSKKILEFKYQVTNKIILSDQRLQHSQLSTVDRLRQHVRRFWVMAETGNPQFVMASNPLSTASGVICVIILSVKLLMAFKDVIHTKILCQSPYKWSTIVIFAAQSIGVLVGTIAPIFRCFSVFSFKLVTNWNGNHILFFRVENYWTQKLHEWKLSPIPSSLRSRSLIYNSKYIILSLCIGFQKVIVVSCKVIWIIAILVPVSAISCLNCWKSLKARLSSPSISSRTNDIDEDLGNYVLQVDNDMELAEKTLKGISNSMNSFILKAAKEQNHNLLELLEKSTGFKGVEIFDTDHVQSLLPVEHVNSWSLPIVSLTCIVIALPNIPKDTVGKLFKSVGEGISYTYLVDESLNRGSEYVCVRKASMSLWNEVENKWKWLGNPLAKDVFKGKTSTEILKWFSDKAKQIVTRINQSTDGELMENPHEKLIAANSMYRITQTMLLRYQSDKEPITTKKLFAYLEDMIGDIFSACFTNIPRVITMRCHESVIEKREASVRIAANLLGKTTKIIERLETQEVSSMDDDTKADIDQWRLHMKQYVP